MEGLALDLCFFLPGHTTYGTGAHVSQLTEDILVYASYLSILINSASFYFHMCPNLSDKLYGYPLNTEDLGIFFGVLFIVLIRCRSLKFGETSTLQRLLEDFRAQKGFPGLLSFVSGLNFLFS